MGSVLMGLLFSLSGLFQGRREEGAELTAEAKGP